MSIRICAFATDVPALEEFLAQSIGQVLQYVVDHGTDRELIVWCWEPDRGPIVAVPGDSMHRVKWGVKRAREEVIWDATRSSDSFLSRRAASVLRDGNSYQLKSLLHALTTCPDIPYVKEISCGYRRWWIGSLLDFAEKSRRFGPEGYSRFVLLWQKVLRRFHCGKALPHGEIDSSSFDFPVIPADDDPDMMVGVWTEEEAYLVVDRLQQLLALSPIFKAPPYYPNLEGDTDDEWNEWVYEMIRQF